MASSYCVNRPQFWRVGVEELGYKIEERINLPKSYQSLLQSYSAACKSVFEKCEGGGFLCCSTCWIEQF